MHPILRTTEPPRRGRRLGLAGVLATLAASAWLAACGGGGDAAAPAAAPAPVAAGSSYVQGPIDGFGSVIVGGVRYDDSTAVHSDDDGNTRPAGAMKLGMQVEVEAGPVDRAAGTAIARRVRWGSEVLGPVGAVDSAGSTVTVLGQEVLVTPSTVFDETLAGGLAALAALPAGSVLEVHGFLGTGSGRITATRIERVTVLPPAWRLRGVVRALDTAARSFRVGNEWISYAAIPAASAAFLANGATVRLVLQTGQVNGAWVAVRMAPGARLPDAGIEAQLEGTITAFTSTSSFEVNGLRVDAAGATFPDGTAGIVLGARVEVSGSVNNGVLVATKVELEERPGGLPRSLELRGELGNLDTVARTFALRGVTVWYGAASVEFRNASVADLANGRRVEVRGVLSADRTRLEARRIEFRN